MCLILLVFLFLVNLVGKSVRRVFLNGYRLASKMHGLAGAGTVVLTRLMPTLL